MTIVKLFKPIILATIAVTYLYSTAYAMEYDNDTDRPHLMRSPSTQHFVPVLDADGNEHVINRATGEVRTLRRTNRYIDFNDSDDDENNNNMAQPLVPTGEIMLIPPEPIKPVIVRPYSRPSYSKVLTKKELKWERKMARKKRKSEKRHHRFLRKRLKIRKWF